MPEMVLTRVDLPAPLSPTRPTTSPAATSKSTPSSACTAPNLLLTPRRARSGVLEFMSWCPFAARGGPPGGSPPSEHAYWRPADLHAAAYADVQICDTVQNLSFTIVSLMLLFVTATGVRITEGTVFLPLLRCWLTRPAGGCLP